MKRLCTRRNKRRRLEAARRFVNQPSARSHKHYLRRRGLLVPTACWVGGDGRNIFDGNLTPRAAVDLILMVDVYHEFDHPFEMVEAMCQSLKPDGRIVFVEFRGEDPNVPIKLVHKMTEAQVRKEMSIHPLDWVETIGTLPQQHIIVFRKRIN